MNIKLFEYSIQYAKGALDVWNEIVNDGAAFPQEKPMDLNESIDFFMSQSKTVVAVDVDTNSVKGVYILHPNNVGRCGHISNASYAVSKDARGLKIGETLVKDCMNWAKALGFKILQFNAVVASNTAALNLYKKLGFTQLGEIPFGFRNKNGDYETIIPHYIVL